MVLYEGDGVQQQFERLVADTKARFDLIRTRRGWYRKNGGDR